MLSVAKASPLLHSTSKAMASSHWLLHPVNQLSDSVNPLFHNPGSLNRDVCINLENSHLEWCREGSDTRTSWQVVVQTEALASRPLSRG